MSDSKTTLKIEIENVNEQLLNVDLNLESLEENIEDKNQEIVEKESEIENFDKDASEVEEMYQERLDEEPTIIAGMEYSTSRVLEEVDPTAYRCGLVDFADTIELENFDGYTELVKELEELEDEKDELESDVERVENEKEELESSLEDLQEELNELE